MIKEMAMKHSIKLSMDTDSIPETITADERKLKQIMYNLLSNAVKFTPEGGEIHLTANLIQSSEIRSLSTQEYLSAISRQLSAQQNLIS